MYIHDFVHFNGNAEFALDLTCTIEVRCCTGSIYL